MFFRCIINIDEEKVVQVLYVLPVRGMQSMDGDNETLSNQEQYIGEIISRIYDAILDSHVWDTVLENIACLTASKSVLLLYQDHEAHQPSLFSSYGFDAKWLTLYNKNHIASDPVFQLIASAPTGEIITMSCRNEAGIVYESETYKEFYRPQGVLHVAGTCLMKNENSTMLLGFQRTKSAPEYQPDILNQVKKLIPHLQKSLHISRAYNEVIVKNDAFAASIDTLQMGMVFFNQESQIMYCNKSASAIINQNPAITMQNQHIFATIDACNKKLKDAIAAASKANRDGAFIQSIAIGLKSSESFTPLPVLITPIHQTKLSPHMPKAGIAVVMTLMDPDQILPTSTEFLSTIYDLTRSEADVAVGLANAMSVKAIASAHGVQLTTIRSQAQSIYAKMGVKSQAQLIKVLLYSPIAMTK